MKINGQPIAFVNEAKYPRMNLNIENKWEEHTKNERNELEIKKKKPSEDRE